MKLDMFKVLVESLGILGVKLIWKAAIAPVYAQTLPIPVAKFPWDKEREVEVDL